MLLGAETPKKAGTAIKVTPRGRDDRRNQPCSRLYAAQDAMD
jgi:hypothetical protein